MPSSDSCIANARAGMPSSPRPMTNTLPARSIALGDRVDRLGRIDQPRLFLGARLAAPQVLGQRRVRIVAAVAVGRARRVAAVAARDRLADRVLEIRIALEAELLAELHHARLADLQRVGELLRGVVAQQVRVLEQEVGDAALDRRHLVALGADFQQRRHGRCGPTVLRQRSARGRGSRGCPGPAHRSRRSRTR